MSTMPGMMTQGFGNIAPLKTTVGQIGANVLDKIPWGALAMWSLDFIRAVRERPLLAKILFRVCIGKYAYREFIGMMDTFQYAGYSPYFGYSLENVDYHKDKIPFINWWVEREGLYNRESAQQKLAPDKGQAEEISK